MTLPDWPRAHGGPVGTAVLRALPEHFQVEEVPRVLPDGQGGHLWLWVEKRGSNTEWTARQLARAAGCAAKDVGFAGMKDRHAVTRQWFSVPAPAAEPDFGEIEGVEVLESARHGRKLRRGTLAGNRFRLLATKLDVDPHRLDERLHQLTAEGVPNYFGPQRFGRGGANLEAASAWARDARRVPRPVRARHLSVLRSAVFNDVLGARVERGDWNQLLPGEQAMLDGSRSLISCEPLTTDLERRCSGFDLHPTGPLAGAGGATPSGDAAEVEADTLQAWSEIVSALGAQRVTADRRALRFVVRNLRWEVSGSELGLTFELPAGAFATVVLRELLDCREPDRDTAAP